MDLIIGSSFRNFLIKGGPGLKADRNNLGPPT